MRRNFITKTDSYKWTHHDMLPVGTTRVYSYLESRVGAEHELTLWFGLQYYLKEYLEGVVVTAEDIAEAKALHAWHLHGPKFNEAGWQHILNKHGGRLPLRILAAPEGLLIPSGNVIMTIENTDPAVPWLTNAVESLLLKVWYPTTVATRSWATKQDILASLARTGGEPAMADYMLHDFGYRGVSSEESAQIGGAAHVVNFKGTDTLEALRFLQYYYGAGTGFADSVAASEHSVMTSLGTTGELGHALHLIAAHPNQILSLVADSYDYYRFVEKMIDSKEIVDRYHTQLVLRPDSTTTNHPTPEGVVAWTLHRLADRLGSTQTVTGHRVVPYKTLWGDGLDPAEIRKILSVVETEGFATQNLVFGMGGGLLQKVNRDTERFALKSSAQERDNVWHAINKIPMQHDKASKSGRLQLVRSWVGNQWSFRTGPEDTRAWTWDDKVLVPVFENGMVLRQELFSAIKARPVLKAKWINEHEPTTAMAAGTASAGAV